MNSDLMLLTIAGILCIAIAYSFGFYVGFKLGFDKEGKHQ